jgi:hypothetical protein
MARGDSYQLQGQQGGVVLGGGDLISGNFRWIQVIIDTVFIDITASNLDNSAGLTSITIPAGIGIGGKFTNIEVSTGTVIAYYE